MVASTVIRRTAVSIRTRWSTISILNVSLEMFDKIVRREDKKKEEEITTAILPSSSLFLGSLSSPLR